MRVLIVEDDPRTAESLVDILEAEDWDVTHAGDGEAGLRKAAAEVFDVIIADRTMPQRDGLSMLSALRDLGVVTPALILSALDAPMERVKGLDSGADDYLTKPYDGPELIARIRALLRRTQYNVHEAVLIVGDLQLRTETKSATGNGVALDLTPKEYALLHYLSVNGNNVVTQRMILENVFNWRAATDPGSPIVPVAIKRLRDKLERGNLGSMIETVRGAGYCLRDPGRAQE